jgi:hypothetical protein
VRSSSEAYTCVLFSLCLSHLRQLKEDKLDLAAQVIAISIKAAVAATDASAELGRVKAQVYTLFVNEAAILLPVPFLMRCYSHALC